MKLQVSEHRILDELKVVAERITIELAPDLGQAIETALARLMKTETQISLRKQWLDPHDS
jgi:hypothetical protein